MLKVVSFLKLSPSVVESVVVILTLSFSAYLGGGKLSDWLAAVAVFLSFACAQISFDMAETPAKASERKCFQQLYLTKELFWIATSLTLQNYPLIASTLVFASYPYWRQFVRSQWQIRSLSKLECV